VLLPVNEPTFGTKRKSQIQTYLEQNQGEGVQHVALFTNEIFRTMEDMRAATATGGFEFMAGMGHDYYERARVKVGDGLTEEQYLNCEKHDILIDKDDQGILLQIFTKPLGDRPTIFFEIIQVICCYFLYFVGFIVFCIVLDLL
jgi:4-hydroxyphenylpyruvate dioxygenase